MIDDNNIDFLLKTKALYNTRYKVWLNISRKIGYLYIVKLHM